ncbi:hypothetical protein D3880_03075 [Pseudomonas cavernae]|uniref:Uncharacterized protein n=1 Tax=Pseudomonas cavernae TaxID=2320867 RepID=A0A385Z0P9_9PSED|nr:hypothetical protein [Pseudomonas cavernae]AYC31433.1 hypothetical protein D3880_03075 [Pseudomonas cavernae]
MKRQGGVSLISLMVGMLLSSLCVLAMLALYKNLVQTAVVATQDANQDGQLTSGLLTAQLELQSAGFGIDSASPPNLLKTTLAFAGVNQPALLWRYLDGAGYQCRGLIDRGASDPHSGKPVRLLSLLQVAGGCSAGAGLSGLNWAVRSDLAKLAVPAAQQAAPQPLVTFDIASLNCAPFGIGAADRHPQVTLSAPSSAQLAGAGGIAPLSYSICLPNIAE